MPYSFFKKPLRNVVVPYDLANRPHSRLGQRIAVSSFGESFDAFIPAPLPPEPSICTDGLVNLLDRANQGLGRLDGLTSILPDVSFLIFMYARKEALLSSQIEGTQSSLSDLLLFEWAETSGFPPHDVEEVLNYVNALNHGLNRTRENVPFSMRLIREMHKILLSSGRGENQQAGEFRRSQNWIGGTRPGNAKYVPPPSNMVTDLMSELERFYHDEKVNLSILIKIGLIHVQFESIHPFLDGNGRLGRLLITLLLCMEGVLAQPLLYLSLYFKSQRDEYYERLQNVHDKGDWEAWLKFYLTGIEHTSDQAVNAAHEIIALFHQDGVSIGESGGYATNTLRLHQLLMRNPITDATTARKALGISAPAARRALERLENLEVVREITGKQRKRIYAYEKYLGILERGTDPIPVR